MSAVKGARIAAVFAICIAIGVLVWKMSNAPLPPSSTNPDWLKFVDRVKNAKRVVTIASFEDPLSIKRILKVVQEPEEGFNIRQVSDKASVINLLTHSEDLEGVPAACFCPHHFVIADNLTIALCYSCGHIAVFEGEKELKGFYTSNVPQSAIEKVFGWGLGEDDLGSHVPCGYFRQSESK